MEFKVNADKMEGEVGRGEVKGFAFMARFTARHFLGVNLKEQSSRPISGDP